jgi:hypothetical protein
MCAEPQTKHTLNISCVTEHSDIYPSVAIFTTLYTVFLTEDKSVYTWSRHDFVVFRNSVSHQQYLYDGRTNLGNLCC